MKVFGKQARQDFLEKLAEGSRQMKGKMSRGEDYDGPIRIAKHPYEDTHLIIAFRDKPGLIDMNPRGETREDFLRNAENYRRKHGLKPIDELTEDDIV